MATGGEFGGSREESLDDLREFTCTPCKNNDNKSTEATHFCPECDTCYCKSCLCDHAVLGRSQIKQWGKAKSSLEDEKCLRHPNYTVHRYCRDHDVVCCRMCLSTDHRLCANTETIPSKPDQMSKDDDLQSIRQEMETLQTKVESLYKDRQLRHKLVERSHSEYLKRLREFRRKINAKFDSIEEDVSKYKKSHDDRFEADLHICDTVKVELSDYQQTINSRYVEKTSYVELKKAKEWVTECNKMLFGLSKTDIKGSLVSVSLSDIDSVLKTVTGLGKLKFTYPNCSVRIEGDDKTCEVAGACQLPNGKIILADSSNKKLKQLDDSYIVSSYCDFQHSPTDVCCISEAEVAVAMGNSTVQFVSVGESLELTRSITLNHTCSRIDCFDSNLVVSNTYQCSSSRQCKCKSYIYIYSQSGQCSKTLTIGKGHGSSGLQYFAICREGNKMYIASQGEYLKTFDVDGNEIACLYDVHSCNRVCLDDTGCVYVSNNDGIIRVEETGKSKIAEILSSEDEIKIPRVLCFDRNHSKVVVSCEKGERVYLI